MSVSATQCDPREICRAINESAPVDFLFEGDRSRLHPDSRLPWRISPEPFWLTPEQHDRLLRLGPAIHAFNKACNLLYHQSVKGLQPAFVHEYLDAGKTERVIELSRLNRVKPHLPAVLRPDLILTADGARVVEVDSVGLESIYVHDAYRSDPSAAFSLSQLAAGPTEPSPMGIFRSFESLSYGEALEAQVTDATERRGRGDIADLLTSAGTWSLD